MANRNSPTAGQSNAATALALVGLVVVALALLGLMVLVLPPLVGIFWVVVIFAVPAVFHYVVWGWWLSQMRDRDDEAGERVEKFED